MQNKIKLLKTKQNKILEKKIKTKLLKDKTKLFLNRTKHKENIFLKPLLQNKKNEMKIIQNIWRKKNNF